MTISDTTTFKSEEQRLIALRDEAEARAHGKPTRANRKALKTAETELANLRSEKTQETASDFENLLDVLGYLETDWKISKSSLYDHKSEGKIRPGRNGRFAMHAVTEYARRYLQRIDGGGTEEKGSLQERKLSEEIRRISSDAELRELRLKERRGELIPREYVEIELAARAGDLKTHLDASVRSSAGRIIKMVSGDPEKTSDLVSFMLAINTRILDNYSRPIQGSEEEEY